MTVKSLKDFCCFSSSADFHTRLMNKYGYYNFRNELLAQTHDITAVTAVHLNDLQIKTKLLASQAVFSQCHTQAMEMILIKIWQVFSCIHSNSQLLLLNEILI